MKVINPVALKSTVIAAAAGLFYLLFWPKQYRLPCPIHYTTGNWCPGCGTTRALDALIHGNLPLAIHFNPLFIASPILLAIAWLIDKSRHKRTLLPIYLSLILALVISFTVLRNLPNSEFAPI